MSETKEKIKHCSYCGQRINIDDDSYFKCLDNFLQTKYFDTEDENIFCCQECFCNYVQLNQYDGEDDKE